MMNVTINDDDAEGQNARGCTIQRSSSNGDTTESIALENNEIIKKCLEIHQGNKLSHENAWSCSLIDRLDTLLHTNHKSLNNFIIAGSVLEASSKVYSLRVDSVHSDVLRMRARLNTKKYDEKRVENDDDDDDNDAEATGGEGSNNSVTIAVASEQVPVKKSKRERSRCRVITNKETLNARLDTVLLQDPVLAKVNLIVGSITAPHRLMNNILLTTNSGLKLCNNFPFWKSTTLQDCDYTEEFHFNSGNETEWAACEGLLEITKKSQNLKLRPLIGGCTITNTPAPTNDDNEFCWDYDGWCNVYNYGEREGGDADNDDDMTNVQDVSMTFDMTSDSEPVPVVREQTHSLDVDYGDLFDLTADKRIAINNCQGLRKASVTIEDLRPVDASCNFEYSYRPSDKISKFWAGPSYWKFKGGHTRQNSEVSINHRARCKRRTLHKQKSKQLRFGEFHNGCFIKLNQFKKCRGDIRKKWDEKKLKLPVDMQLPPDLFQHYILAPNTVIHENGNDTNVAKNDVDAPEQHHVIDNNDASVNNLNNDFDMNNKPNTQAENTVLEIPTTLEGAPIQVPPIVVPFARQAKVVDMKNLKSSCSILLNQQMQRPSTQTKDVQYGQGVTSFQEIYKDLPQLLTQSNKKALSPSLAFWSILHSASELALRLTPHEDLKDFTIRKIDG